MCDGRERCGAVDARRVSVGQFAHCVRRSSGNGHDVDRSHCAIIARRHTNGCLLDDQMRVRAAEAERTDGSETCARRRPVFAARHRQSQMQRLPIDVRRRPFDVELRRYTRGIEHQHRLDQRRDAGRTFEMPDIRLHRSDDQRRIGSVCSTIHGTERAQLDRIAEWRAGSVGFHDMNVRAIQATLRECATDDRFLRGPAWRGETGRRTVLVDGRTTNHGQHAIAIGTRVTEPLEHDDAASFTAHETVCGSVERFASTVRREHLRAAECDERFRRQDDVHARREREITLAGAQILAGEMHRDQRG